MREQLVQYIDLLFAGTADSDEMKQEILQNTLDRFDDLVAQGKTPEAAYRLSISGIGDISEILGSTYQSVNISRCTQNTENENLHTETIRNRNLRAIGIALYILCAIPLFLLCDLGYETLGLTLTILLVAVATYIMIITGKNEPEKEEHHEQTQAPESALKNSISKFCGAVTLAVYLIVSFSTGAWYITWLIFPISGCIKGLINAVIDLKEACSHEN